MDPLASAGVLDLIDGDQQLTDTIGLHHAPGHTPGHQVMWIESGGRRALISADTWNHPLQLAHPEWWSGSDDDHEGAEATRRKLLVELLADPETIVAPTHFAEAFFTIVSPSDGRPTWQQVG